MADGYLTREQVRAIGDNFTLLAPREKVRISVSALRNLIGTALHWMDEAERLDAELSMGSIAKITSENQRLREKVALLEAELDRLRDAITVLSQADDHTLNRVVSFLRGEWGEFSEDSGRAIYTSRLRDADRLATLAALAQQLQEGEDG